MTTNTRDALQQRNVVSQFFYLSQQIIYCGFYLKHTFGQCTKHLNGTHNECFIGT